MSRHVYHSRRLRAAHRPGAKSAWADAKAERQSALLWWSHRRARFHVEDAREAAGERASRPGGVGRPIGACDLLIAGRARRCGARLVTANGAEFGCVEDP